jgi:diphthamide biosynthesis protein 2
VCVDDLRVRAIFTSFTDAGDLASKAQALSIRNQQSALSTVLSSAGGEFLASRTYQGLDPRYGQDAPSAIEIGRSGIARGYDGDRSAASSSSKQTP